MKETSKQRIERITAELQKAYPGKNIFDLNSDGTHLVCEIEPTQEHPEYDKAIEVMIKTRPHKHMKTIQIYTILKGTLKLHLDDEVVIMKPGDTQTIPLGVVHWAESDDECWDELHSIPGWTAEDHIFVK